MIRWGVEKASRSDGFSSVETLASMVVLAVVSLGVTSSTLTSIQTNQVLECVRSQIAAGRPLNAANAGADCNPAGAPTGYVLSIAQPAAGTGAFAGMTRIQATISWASPLPGRVRVDSYLDT